MDYLRSFIIGSSGLVVFQFFATLALQKKGVYTIPYKKYSILAPIYFGLMNILSLYIGKTYNLSLERRFFIISIISILFTVSFNYFFSSKKYKPYSTYDTKDWIYYILINGARHIIAFNLIMFYFEKYFSKSYPLKVFIIGSSAISYLLTYYSVAILDNKNKLNYDYKLFTIFEPLLRGIELMFAIFVLKNMLNKNLKDTLIIYSIFGTFLWFIPAYHLKIYNYTNKEWFDAFARVFIARIVKYYILYNLLINLK